jgi:hypothetical protein
MPSISTIERLETREYLHASWELHVQFAPAKVTPVQGYVIDSGLPLGDRGGELTYGWLAKKSASAIARRATAASPDSRYYAFARLKAGAVWEVSLPNGVYEVHVVSGDPKATKGKVDLNVEGIPVLQGEMSRERRWLEATRVVTVEDGTLELAAPPGSRGNKVNAIDITAVHADADAPPAEPTPPNADPEIKPPLSTPTTILTWQKGPASPISRAEALGAVAGGKLYVFGGLHGRGKGYSFPATTRADMYDPATGEWARLHSMPEAFTHTTAMVDGTTIWFVGGYAGDSPGPGSAHVWKYDTLSDTWSRGVDLPAPRGSGASAILGRMLHYFGGGDENRVDRADHWALNLDDPDRGWTALAPLPQGRNHLAGAAVAGKIYAVGGQRGDMGNGLDLAEVDVYDPATESWSPAAPSPRPRSHVNCSILVLNDKILIVGGESPGLESEIIQFDPLTQAWTTFATLPEPRSTAVAGIIGGQLLVATGNAPGETDDLWIGTIV